MIEYNCQRDRKRGTAGLGKNTWDGIRTNSPTIHLIESALYLVVTELTTAQCERITYILHFNIISSEVKVYANFVFRKLAFELIEEHFETFIQHRMGDYNFQEDRFQLHLVITYSLVCYPPVNHMAVIKEFFSVN